MEKRFGVQANIEGYELDKDDTEGKEIIDAYRKGNDMADLMELAESDNLTLDDSVGGPLLYSVDSHVGMSQSPAQKAAAKMNNVSSSVSSPPSQTGSTTQVSPPTASDSSSSSKRTTAKTVDKNGNVTNVIMEVPPSRDRVIYPNSSPRFEGPNKK